jgi:hypothetical protein
MINENERLNAVNRFVHLEAGINKDLTDLVDLIARICNVPVALVTIIDDKTQWIKASVGVGTMRTNERNLSFCQETIQHDDLLVVNDATLDERFAHLPVVSGPPHIRFYAGMPLVTYDGHAVGTVCVLDVKPVELTDLQKDTLKVFAKQVQNLIELSWSTQSLIHQNASNRIQEKMIEDSDLKLKAVFDSSKDLHLLIGRDMEIMAFNKAAVRYIKEFYGKELKLGGHFLSVVNPALMDSIAGHVEMAFGGASINAEWLVRPEEPTAMWLSVDFEPISNDGGKVIGVAINAADITTQKLNARQITLQNDALQRIAIIQSHELRRPVASIMGLMEVMKLDENYIANSYHPMMEATINELDTKIRSIVRESELTLSNTVAEAAKAS